MTNNSYIQHHHYFLCLRSFRWLQW